MCVCIQNPLYCITSSITFFFLNVILTKNMLKKQTTKSFAKLFFKNIYRKRNGAFMFFFLKKTRMWTDAYWRKDYGRNS